MKWIGSWSVQCALVVALTSLPARADDAGVAIDASAAAMPDSSAQPPDAGTSSKADTRAPDTSPGKPSTNCERATEMTRLDHGFLVEEGPQRRPRWQPPGGRVVFTVETGAALTDAYVLVCFRWKQATASQAGSGTRVPFMSATASIRRVDGKRVTLDVTVPELGASLPRGLWGADPSRPIGVYSAPWTAPTAEVRIMFLHGADELVEDVVAEMGITSTWWALFASAVAVLGAVAAAVRIRALGGVAGVRGLHPFLLLVSTKEVYASLSQLQILLWTFVIGGSAVYVMALSGELVEITQGALVLLGISGFAMLANDVHRAKDESKLDRFAKEASDPASDAQAQAAAKTVQVATGLATEAEKRDATAATVAAERVAAANAAALASRGARELADRQVASASARGTLIVGTARMPLWRDLVVRNGEIDVTRVQMLFFTVISATFVVIQVLSSYVIPDIPIGFVTLMGISNGVYVGSKIASGDGAAASK